LDEHQPRKVMLIVTIDQYPDDGRAPEQVRRDVQAALVFKEDATVSLAANSWEADRPSLRDRTKPSRLGSEFAEASKH
jgi:hypothetical protein